MCVTYGNGSKWLVIQFLAVMLLYLYVYKYIMISIFEERYFDHVDTTLNEAIIYLYIISICNEKSNYNIFIVESKRSAFDRSIPLGQKSNAL